MKVLYIGVLGVAALVAVQWAMAAAPATDSVVGAAAQVDIINPKAGVARPWGSQVPYRVEVAAGGKSSRFGEIPSSAVVVAAGYLADVSTDDVARNAPELPSAVAAIAASNCLGCHGFSNRAAGPSFDEIRDKYQDDKDTAKRLADHIRYGSSGVWGAAMMPPHPELDQGQVQDIARWLSVKQQPGVSYSVGATGTVKMVAPAGSNPGPKAGMVIAAFYTGPGGAGASSRSGNHTVVVKGAQ